MPINNSSYNLREVQDDIRASGEIVNYYQGMKCSCTLMQDGSNLPDANRARPDCAACKGLGILWIGPTQIRGLVTNIEQQKDLLMAGIVTPGDLIFSPALQNTLYENDKIQLTWSVGIPFSGELIQRGTGSTDTSMYGIVSVPSEGCITVDPATGAITQYVPNVDFSYSGNVITWGLSDNQPSMGSIYSIKYSAVIDWIVFYPPQLRYERGTNLGQRVILRKKHLVFNGV